MHSSEIADETALGITPQWDSLAHMRLILNPEASVKRRLDPAAIVSITNLADVITVIGQSD